MAPIPDHVSPRYPLPGVRAISSEPSPVDMTMGRSLPPLPQNMPQRDVFNPITNRNFLPSPISTHETFSARPVLPPAVSPPSPAYSADSWPDSTESQISFRSLPDPSVASIDEIMSLLFPPPEQRTRKRPLQQCGRKRKLSAAGFEDVMREKHRVAEADRRKNLSILVQGLDDRLHDFFLELAGWKSSKNSMQSKEHIIKAAIILIDYQKLIIRELFRGGNKLPCDLQGRMQCQRLVASLQQQNEQQKQEIMDLREKNKALEEKVRALEHQLNASGHMFCSPKVEHSSLRQLAPVPESKPKVMLPGLQGFDRVADISPDSARFNTSPPKTSQSYYGQSFLSRTPPSTGPSSPVFHQDPCSAASRPPSFIQTP
ncbi:hypothetical protein BDW67DRAFT_155189 [Aspergillus spinulosporus]